MLFLQLGPVLIRRDGVFSQVIPIHGCLLDAK